MAPLDATGLAEDLRRSGWETARPEGEAVRISCPAWSTGPLSFPARTLVLTRSGSGWSLAEYSAVGAAVRLVDRLHTIDQICAALTDPARSPIEILVRDLLPGDVVLGPDLDPFVLPARITSTGNYVGSVEVTVGSTSLVLAAGRLVTVDRDVHIENVRQWYSLEGSPGGL